MADDEIREHARSLSEEPIELIRCILDKHHAALCEELRDQVKRFSRERREAKELLREWIDAWAKGRNETNLVGRTEIYLSTENGEAK